MHVTDIKTRLLADYCVANNLNPLIPESNVIWSSPELWIEGDCNSRVLVTVKERDMNYRGVIRLTFNRYPISTALKGVRVPGKSSDYNGLYEVIDVLKKTLGLPMDRTEYFNTPVRGDSVTIAPAANSMAYLPSSTVTLRFQYDL